MIKGCLAIIGGFVVLVVIIGAIGASHSSSTNSKYDTNYSTASTSDSSSDHASSGPDYCAKALAYEKMAASSDVSHAGAYKDAVAGLAANEQCGDEDSQLINKGYLLSMKAFAEHYLSYGDAKTDFNQANSLLVECQTRPGIYGTHTGAECETQESNNISTENNWELQQAESQDN